MEPPFDAVVAVNLVHVAPLAATAGLLAGAGRVLRRGGRLLVYGPLPTRAQPRTLSSHAFNAVLAAWHGTQLRDVEELDELCSRGGGGGGGGGGELRRVALEEQRDVGGDIRLAVFEKGGGG